MNHDMRKKIARIIASDAFFKAELFTRYYAADFTMDIPTAPPGMPNHYDTWEAETCFTWLNRTVRKWNVTLKEFYGSKDHDGLFWAIGEIDADVHWGDHDGRFASMSVLKIVVSQEGKVEYLSWRADPSEMLVAAGRKRPEFDVETAITKLDMNQYQWFRSLVHFDKEPVEYPAGNSKQDKESRIQMIIDQHSCGVDRERYRKLPRREEFKGGGIFIPKQQLEATERHIDEKTGGINRVFAWVKVSSPWMYRDPRNRVYATDDPHVYFAEMNCHGPGCWYGIEGKTGHYHQNYLVYMRVDDEGYLTSWYEILNNINILNASNISMESFPYYY